MFLHLLELTHRMLAFYLFIYFCTLAIARKFENLA